MAYAVSRRALNEEARNPSRGNSFEICGGQIGTGTGLSESTSVNMTAPMLHTQLVQVCLRALRST
jgi:hypothetical protein